MRLYVIRHAEARPLEFGAINGDAERPLTERGHDQARQLGATLQSQGIALHGVLTSPLLRARQTAEGIVSSWGQPRPNIVLCEELSPDTKTKKLARVLREQRLESLALVGHQPDLGEHLAWFIGDKKAQIVVAKAGIALVVFVDEIDKGTGVLEWLVTPDWWLRQQV